MSGASLYSKARAHGPCTLFVCSRPLLPSGLPVLLPQRGVELCTSPCPESVCRQAPSEFKLTTDRILTEYRNLIVN